MKILKFVVIPNVPIEQTGKQEKGDNKNYMNKYKKKFLIVGSGGRESAFATRLAEDIELYAFIGHKNKTIIDCVNQTNGKYEIGNTNDPNQILEFAKTNKIDYAFVSADEPLANGVINILISNNIKAIGGTKEAARIEWDKVYSIEMMQKICPEFTPFYQIISKPAELNDALHEFELRGLQVVVKPQGLTGGKGVKVMPEHLATWQDCTDYASLLLKQYPDEQVLLVEKLEGIEFTIMGITDGTNLVISPASYDYPFRYENDVGAGTGGMGCFTSNEKKLPFMTDDDLENCKFIMQKIIDEIRHRDYFFNGVLNGGFFKTKDGIKFMEFNGRFGDPEGLNILSILEGSFSELLIHIWNKTLSDNVISFIKKASVTKYLVAKEYPNESQETSSFFIDEKQINQLGVKIYFGSCVQTGQHEYQTLKKSRVVAFSSISDVISDASDIINYVIDTHVSGSLEYRRDIGAKKSLQKLEQLL